jgi:hypothetical protein
MVNKKQEISNDATIVAKKRGRKSKKELEEIAQQEQISKYTMQNNINVIIEDSNKDDDLAQIDDLLNSDDLSVNNEIINANTQTFLNENENENENDIVVCDDKPLPKKRGRKPKGGKIIQQVVSLDSNKEIKPNVILHLKCSMKDLQSNGLLGNDIQSYNFSNTPQLSYDILNENNSKKTEQYTIRQESIIEDDNDYDEDEVKSTKENDIRDIWKKLNILEHNLHTNNICDKKSACFWCTCEFDNPPVYIPKHYIKDAYDVYGCFCSPECATAYLMEEHIDSSSKFERYHLMNNIYAKIYDYKKNIKPAPNPYYMLDKYYGNLTIQEYRSLLRNERLFLVVDKPLTRVLPELHEDNDDFIINNKIIPSNTYQIKKKLQKKQTKNNILSERFGLNQ